MTAMTLPRRVIALWPGAQRRLWFHAPTAEPRVAITIDDSPHPATTDPILAVLARHGAHATFFITGDHAALAPGALDRIAAGGHELANHLMADRKDYARPDQWDRFRRDFDACDALIRPHGAPAHFRPPSALYSDRMLRHAAQAGYRTVLADAFAFDTVITAPPLARGLLRRWMRPGAITVLHDGGRGGDRGRRTAQTLDWLLGWLGQRSLRPVTLKALFGAV